MFRQLRVILLFITTTHSALAVSLVKHTQVIYLGNTPVQLVRYHYKTGKNFIHLHESEYTAKKAAIAYIKKHGGSLVTLVHSGKRNISFVLRHQRYECDPNRIFSDRGIKKTLRAQSHYSPAAKEEVKKLARAILAALPKGKIIAVHNNETYSMLDYYPGHELETEARALQKKASTSLRNFFLVTQKQSFVRLQRLKQNIVWQSPFVEDDGSLSVYLARRDYINIEAAYDAFRQQRHMLEIA